MSRIDVHKTAKVARVESVIPVATPRLVGRSGFTKFDRVPQRVMKVLARVERSNGTLYGP